MKKYSYFILGLFISTFTACDLIGESNYQPELLLSVPILNHSDSLSIRLTDDNNYLMDTIHVGDTVSFLVLSKGFANNLKEFNLIQSSDSVSRIILPPIESMDSIFSSTSDYNKGKFLFKSPVNLFFFSFSYVAVKASKEAKLIFSIRSDASFEYNQNSFLLKTPILDPVKVNEQKKGTAI